MNNKKPVDPVKDQIYKHLLAEVTGLYDVPMGAFNIRSDGEGAGRKTTANIDIVTKADQPGIEVRVKPGTKNESIHIPVVIGQTGLHDLVYNDFYIGEGADVTIVAGCAIHNPGTDESSHDGIHRFFLAENARVKYLEKHYGEGEGKRVLNPTTVIELGPGSHLEMDSVQIQGVDSTVRRTEAVVGDGASLIVSEKIMTEGEQTAETIFDVKLDGEESRTHLISRSVVRGRSRQKFVSQMTGNNKSRGHSECDAILMDQGKAVAIPEVTANHLEAELIHEAVIGKIAGEQLTKLMTLGLSEKEAEARIISGFMK
ncbi:MAG TPA: SufD family Fe-S cluster assembly protein [Bacillota bacterium]|jgi:Fe-S cluster assembly scaffold protein SufB|nr:SufD family Fe-S cluster assembly protein [Fastidiosipila sp.]HPX93834.1 SufD family Fe-S cluster assembly protein [Bacillota bacterium]HQB81700.1 SufD family Fe-S cluster assembly protein [Bacillota bacterium]